MIANNSGGMRCGVVADSYRTVRSLTLVLANGAVIDTADADAEEQFAAAAPELARGLDRDPRRAARRPLSSPSASARKFEIKNTMGYRLCAFLDADEPLEIFRRLVIGSEGTLAFVAEAVFETVPFGAPRDDGARVLSRSRCRGAARSAPLVDGGRDARPS